MKKSSHNGRKEIQKFFARKAPHPLIARKQYVDTHSVEVSQSKIYVGTAHCNRCKKDTFHRMINGMTQKVCDECYVGTQ